MIPKPGRGKVAPGKRQCNIRLRVDYLELIKAEAEANGFNSWVKQLEHILQNRYYPEKTGRKKGGA